MGNKFSETRARARARRNAERISRFSVRLFLLVHTARSDLQGFDIDRERVLALW